MDPTFKRINFREFVNSLINESLKLHKEKSSIECFLSVSPLIIVIQG